jgi:hypothetical protein
MKGIIPGVDLLGFVWKCNLYSELFYSFDGNETDF